VKKIILSIFRASTSLPEFLSFSFNAAKRYAIARSMAQASSSPSSGRTAVMWPTSRKCRQGASAAALALGLVAVGFTVLRGAAQQAGKERARPLVRSARSGPWSAPATWDGGKFPTAGSKVQVRAGHAVVYDLDSDEVIRSIHVAGTLTFAADKNTRLDVGL